MCEHSCKRCGDCCCNFPITTQQAEKMKKVLKESPKLAKSLLRPFNPEGCIFLMHNPDDTWTCAIYDKGVRPLICEVFGTKGFDELSCPKGTYSTKYSAKEAESMLREELRSAPKMQMMNSIMLPYIIELAGK